MCKKFTVARPGMDATEWRERHWPVLTQHGWIGSHCVAEVHGLNTHRNFKDVPDGTIGGIVQTTDCVPAIQYAGEKNREGGHVRLMVRLGINGGIALDEQSFDMPVHGQFAHESTDGLVRVMSYVQVSRFIPLGLIFVPLVEEFDGPGLIHQIFVENGGHIFRWSWRFRRYVIEKNMPKEKALELHKFLTWYPLVHRVVTFIETP